MDPFCQPASGMSPGPNQLSVSLVIFKRSGFSFLGKSAQKQIQNFDYVVLGRLTNACFGLKINAFQGAETCRKIAKGGSSPQTSSPQRIHRTAAKGGSTKVLTNAQMPVVEHVRAVSLCWETWPEWHEPCHSRFRFPSNNGSSAVHSGYPLCLRMAIRARDALIASHAQVAYPRWWIFRTWSFARSAKGPGQGPCITQPGPVSLAGHCSQTQADRLAIKVDENPTHHRRV